MIIRNKRFFTLLLALCLVLAMLPLTAAAAEAPPDDAVTVYFTVEGPRGGFATAGGKTMALQKLTVPYFDLALYGREDLYYNPDCYAGAGQSSQKPGTQETADGVVTILHLFIYATEVFREGLDPENAGKGYLAEADWPGFEVYTAQAGSGFVYFWDYSNNITYYLNYEYPLGKVGWGSTCDQIPIKDGDIITVRNDNGTEGYGTYHHFDKKGLITKEIKKGNQLNMTLFKTTKTADYSGTGHEPVGAGHKIMVAEELGGEVLAQTTTNEYGDFRLDTSKLPKGRYYVYSDTYGPAVMLLLVGEHEYLPKVTAPTCTEAGYTTYTCACGKSYTDDVEPAAGHKDKDGVCSVCGQNTNAAMYGDLNGDKSVTAMDASLAAQCAAKKEVDIDTVAADVNGDNSITAMDASLIRQYAAKKINQFPAEGNQ